MICSNCVLDDTINGIYFDGNGICNFCKEHSSSINKRVESNSTILNGIISKIKRESSGPYDCVIGLSGGVDSSYLAFFLVKIAGLKPLAVHVDNGWNTALAVQNIKKIVEKLNIDLCTEVLDWDIFRDVQLAFFRANLPDIEIPTDHIINSVLYKVAISNKIKYIINGMVYKEESISVPEWSYGHSDLKYLSAVLKSQSWRCFPPSLPHFSLLKLFGYLFFYRVRVISMLNYLDYNKEKAQNLLMKEVGYIPYIGKHNESFITKFLQDYILIKKFNYDKRKGHLSGMIYSKAIERQEALLLLEKKPYVSKADIDYFCDKMGIERVEFDTIINNGKKYSFRNFQNNYSLIVFLKKIYNTLRLLKIVYK